MAHEKSIAEVYSDPANAVAHWIVELDLAQKSVDDWHKRAHKIIKRYKDERGAGDGPFEDSGKARFNVLWSNVQTLQPLLYARTPKPSVERRFKDSDPIGRQAAENLERALRFALSSQAFDQTMKSVRDDFLLPGRGQAWVRYVPQMVERAVTPDPAGETPEQISASSETGNLTEAPLAVAESPQQMEEEVVFEEVIVEYVHWTDFFHSPARVWDEVRYVARRVYMYRDQGVKRFGEIFHDVPLNKSPDGYKKDNVPDGVRSELFRQAEIFEIWDKTTRNVYWIARDFEQFLDVKADPLGLKDFFPCPRPLLATTTTDSLIPCPDFTMYQDQAREIDRITERIAALIPMVKITGIYDGSKKEIQRIFTENANNALIPSDNWMTIAQGGGLNGFMDLIPFDQVSAALAQLYECRERSKQVLYEVTGLSDLMRGTSDSRTTATAEQIKGEFSKARLADRQGEMQRFARDCIALMGEIICEQFSVETFALMCGISTNGDARALQDFIPSVELLKNDALRTFRIEIETDSTIAVNENIDKQARVEFLSAVSQFLPQALQTFQQVPELGPAMAEMLLFGIRGFRAGRGLESAVEQAVQQLMQAAEQDAQNPQEAPQDPAMVKVQGELQIKQVELDLEKQKTQYMLQLEEMKMQHKQQMDLRDSDANYSLRMAQAQGELQLKAEDLRNANTIATNKALLESQINLQPKVETQPIPPINISMVMPGGRKRAVMVDPATGAQRIAEIETLSDDDS